ncbi:MAG: hypothetical protein J3Q66DRAFT_133677 [Benniella sp.]|nr:MAG: hypothetical protein J3Q66DRAFT_133677 [Benniella sp.]
MNRTIKVSALIVKDVRPGPVVGLVIRSIARKRNEWNPHIVLCCIMRSAFKIHRLLCTTHRLMDRCVVLRCKDTRSQLLQLEIGDPARFQKRFVESALLKVTNILSHFKMIEDEHKVQDYNPIVCARSYWIFTKGDGILNVLPDVNTWVRKGEVIATLHNIFDEE